MTRFRLAAIAALCIPAMLVTVSGAPGGVAPTDDFDLHSTCRTAQRTDRDFAKIRSEARRRTRRHGSAAAVEPVVGAKVVTKLTDLTTQNGNNVVDAKDADTTNDDGVAKTKVEFDNFGNYKATSKLKVGGDVVAKDTVKFGVADRVSGKCDPPLSGPPQ